MAEPIVIEVTLDDSEIGRGADRAREKLNTALDRGRAAAEESERAHIRRIQSIHEQHAARLREIEARRQAQIDVIRERAVQKQIEQQRRLERASQAGAASFGTFLRRHSATIREAGESLQAAGFAALSLTAAVVGVGRAAVRSAVQIDQQVNTLRALTGSSEAAEKRFAQLVATAQKTPGLTASLAATLDAQLRVANVTVQTIDKVLPAIGRLNAVSPLGDPQKFASNLVQLVTQNFERSDLKELVGQSPLAGELIRQIFNVESPTNAKAIRAAAQRLGITTVDRFFEEIANAAATNSKLQNVTESLGTAFEKMRDRAIVALRPIGLAIVQTLAPLVESAIPIIERITAAFAAMPAPVRAAIVVFGPLAAALGPILIVVGSLIQTFGALGSLVSILAGAGGVGALVVALGPLALVLAAVAEAVAVLAVAFATDFGGIRTVVFDVINFISNQFAVVKQAFRDSRDEIDRLKIQLAVFSEEVRPLIRLLGELFKDTFERPIRGAIILAKSALQFFNEQLALTIIAFRTIKSLLKDIANAVTPGLGIGTLLQGRAAGGRASDSLPPSGGGINAGEELNFLVEQNLKLFGLDPRLKRGGGGGGSDGVKAKKSEVDQLVSTVKELNREIEVLRAATGQEFRLQIRQEELQDTKRTLEEIIDLRRKLNLLQAPVPAGTEQAQLEALQFLSGKRPDRPVALQPALPELRPDFRILDTSAAPPAPVLVRLEAERVRLQQSQNALRLAELRISNQIELGVLSEAEGRSAILGVQRQHRDEIIRSLEAQRSLSLEAKNFTEVSEIDIQIEGMRTLGVELSAAQRFMRGFGSATETVRDAFDRLGTNVSRALLNVKDLLNSLKQAVLGFFNDLLGVSLQNLFRSIFAPLIGGASGGATGGGGGGGLFRTPPTFPTAIAQAFAGAGGGNLAAPPSISALSQFFGSSVPLTAGVPRGGLDEFFGAGVPRTAGQLGIGALLGGLFKGFGFGLKPGSGTGQFAAAAPLLGLTLGAGLGGQSTLGQIVGGAGGALLGIGATAAPSALAGTALAPLFSNPITAIVGAGLLVGSIFLGKASQRRKDEEASGQMLTQAINAIVELKAGIASDQIDGAQAEAIFNTQILGVFMQQINTLKTASVRESRLRNQTADLRRTFNDLIPPEVEAQQRRRLTAQRSAAIDSRLIPQFAIGGISSGGLALLHPSEMVLTPGHQSAIRFLAGADVFDRVGVPGAGQQVGGTAQPARSALSDEPITLNIEMYLGMSGKDAERIFVVGGSTRSGRQVVVNTINGANQRSRAGLRFLYPD